MKTGADHPEGSTFHGRTGSKFRAFPLPSEPPKTKKAPAVAGAFFLRSCPEPQRPVDTSIVLPSSRVT